MKIQTKITATYVMLAVIIVVCLGIFISIWMESYFKDRLVTELSRQADMVYYILQEDTVRSFAQVDEQVKQVGGLENLRISLIDELGNVLADSDVPLPEIAKVTNHFDRPEIQQAKSTGIGHDIRQSTTVDRPFLYMAKEVKKSPSNSIFQNLHYIRLSVPFEQVQRQIDQIRSIVIVTGLGVLLAIIAVSVLVSRRLTHSMKQIVRSVERIRSGELDAQLTVKSDDEIGLVANAINELVEKLKADIIQLKKLEQVRTQFLGNVSHELRTPIFAVQGYLETLLNGAVDDPSVNHVFLEKAQSNLGRLNALLEDLIKISQIESGEMKMSFRYFRLNEFLESIIKDYEPMAAASHVILKLLHKTSAEDEVYGDKERLRQVLNNLISNAIHYNKSEGEVLVCSETSEHGVELSVKDTGVGISSDHIPRIFERFYRVDSDRSRALGGTGLGLAIVKHIIEAHGSQILVDSIPGEGSVFKFILKKS